MARTGGNTEGSSTWSLLSGEDPQPGPTVAVVKAKAELQTSNPPENSELSPGTASPSRNITQSLTHSSEPPAYKTQHRTQAQSSIGLARLEWLNSTSSVASNEFKHPHCFCPNVTTKKKRRK